MHRIVSTGIISIIALLWLATHSSAFCPVSFIPGNVACEGQAKLKWTGPYHPSDIIKPNSQKSVSIKGGCPPYSWSVKGNGYWLENDLTYDLENILYSDTVSDCLVSITVIDKYGQQVTGYLRRPGRWVSLGSICKVPGPPTRKMGYNRYAGWRYERIEGGLKQYQSYRYYYFFGTCLWTEPPCGNQRYSCVPKANSGQECLVPEVDGFDRREYPCAWQSPEAWSESNDNYDHSGCTNKGAMGWTSMVCIYSKNLTAYEWQCD